jgi:hypothetical protein
MSAPTRSSTRPLRDRDETELAAVLSVLFKLRRSQGRVLARLTTVDYSTLEELRDAINHDSATVIARNTMFPLISELRNKLAPHNVKIATVSRLGYGLSQEARSKIRKVLARYDAGRIPTVPRSSRLGITDTGSPQEAAAIVE